MMGKIIEIFDSANTNLSACIQRMLINESKAWNYLYLCFSLAHLHKNSWLQLIFY